MSAGIVRLELSEGVALLTLSRPARRNALDLPMWEGLRDQVVAATAAGARAVILTGEGSHFCSGMDLKPDNPLAARVGAAVFGGDPEEGKRIIEELKALMAPLLAFPGLSIAAIEGACLGGGLEVALHCDVRVAARDAIFGLPEPRWGMVPDVGGTTLLTRLVGPGRAAMIVGTGRRFLADQAFGLGVVEHLAAPGGALIEARSIARDALACAPTASREALALIRAVPGLSREEACTRETAAGAAALASGEVAEGLAAFIEKRAPGWAPG